MSANFSTQFASARECEGFAGDVSLVSRTRWMALDSRKSGFYSLVLPENNGKNEPLTFVIAGVVDEERHNLTGVGNFSLKFATADASAANGECYTSTFLFGIDYSYIISS